jgi:hypothetical protein
MTGEFLPGEPLQLPNGKRFYVIDNEVHVDIDQVSTASYGDYRDPILHTPPTGSEFSFDLRVKGGAIDELRQVLSLGQATAPVRTYGEYSQVSSYDMHDRQITQFEDDSTNADPLPPTNWSLGNDSSDRGSQQEPLAYNERQNRARFRFRRPTIVQAVGVLAAATVLYITPPLVAGANSGDEAAKHCVGHELIGLIPDFTCYADHYIGTVLNPANRFPFIPESK